MSMMGKDMNHLKQKKREQRRIHQIAQAFNLAGGDAKGWALRLGFLIGKPLAGGDYVRAH